jgi:D-xylose transport system permease protein
VSHPRRSPHSIFIVTLGGLLVWRGAAGWVTSGQTVAPLDGTFTLMGGGPEGSIGATGSWVVGLVACAAVVLSLANSRAQRKKFHFPLRPRSSSAASPAR